MSTDMTVKYEWVELVDPRSQETIYVNLSSGECTWNPPPNQLIKPRSSDQWWELFDIKAQRNYYYNCSSQETVWQRPEYGDIIPLANLQLMHQATYSDDERKPRETTASQVGQISSATSLASMDARMRQHKENPRLPDSNRPNDDNKVSTTRIAEDSDHERVRDWLQSAAVQDAEEENGTTCLSDRPARRMHQLRHSSQHAITSSDLLVENVSSSRSSVASIHRATLPMSHTNELYQSSHIVTTRLSTGEPPCFERSSLVRHSKKIESEPAVSHSHIQTYSINLPHNSNVQNQSIKLLLSPHSGHNQRVFPRTNPTASRPLGVTKGSLTPQSLFPMGSDFSQQIEQQQSQESHFVFDQPVPSVPLRVASAAPSNMFLSSNITPRLPLNHPMQTLMLSSNDPRLISFDWRNSNQTTSFRDPFSDTSIPSSHTSSGESSDTDNSRTSSERIEDLLKEYRTQPTQHVAGKELFGPASNTAYVSNYLALEKTVDPPVPPPRSASTLGSQRFIQSIPLADHTFPGNRELPSILSNHAPCVSTHNMFDVKPAFDQPKVQAKQSQAHVRSLAQHAHHESRHPPLLSILTTDSVPASSPVVVQPEIAQIPTATVEPVICNQDELNTQLTAVEALSGNHLVPTSTTLASSTANNVHKSADNDSIRKFGSIRSNMSESSTRDSNLKSLGGFFSSIDAQELYPALLGYKRSRRPFYTLVYPGHPDFDQLTTPFDWPKKLFKSNQDINSLMSWTKGAFTKRILACTSSSVKKQVLDIFKIIQSFMGDHKARLSLPDYGSIIIHRALNSVSVRDELFAQLCKQTTNNTNIKSLTNGWALLCVCLYYFPPNNSSFRDSLRGYLDFRAKVATDTSLLSPKHFVKRADQTIADTSSTITEVFASSGSASSLDKDTPVDKIKPDPNPYNVPPVVLPVDLTLGTCDRPTVAHFARVAPRWFERAVNIGVRKFPDPPSLHEICHVKDFVLKPNVFGSTLEEIMRIQATRFPNLKLPWIQIFLTEELLRMNGATTEGVFRLSSDLDMLTEVRCQLEKLFEVFRVVCNNSSNAGSASSFVSPSIADRFLILRPPPSGWIPFCNHSGTTPSADSSPVSPAWFPDASLLTGEYSWPLIPTPLTSSPTEFILLTPSAQWPRNLRMMSNASNFAFTEEQVDAHLAAALLKLWLRELAHPLIPDWLQPECVKAAQGVQIIDSYTDKEITENLMDQVISCCRLIRKIAPLPRRSLLYLILLLQHLVKPEYSSLSLMNPRNLATVITPNLMRSTMMDPQKMLEYIRPQTLFVRLLISYLDINEEIQVLLADEQEELARCG